MRPFRDRAEAGQVLADLLLQYATVPDLLVLSLPRGGVPVGFEVARTLGAPFDVFLVRKLGVPGMEELAVGAIASGGLRVLNDAVIQSSGISEPLLEQITERERHELERREREYREGRPAPIFQGRSIILIDDGLATGATMRVAARVIRQQNPARLVVAVPIAPREVCESLQSEVDEIICACTPHPFTAVGYGYQDFSQTTDKEVKSLLAKADKFSHAEPTTIIQDRKNNVNHSL